MNSHKNATIFFFSKGCNTTVCDCDGIKGAVGSVGPPGVPGLEGQPVSF